MNSVVDKSGYERNMFLLLLTVLSSLLAISILCGIVGLFPAEVPSRLDISKVIFIFLDQVCPEPVERHMFLLSVITLPFNITGWYLFWRMVLSRVSPQGVHRAFLWCCSVTLVGVLFYLIRIRVEAEFFVNNIAAGGVWYSSCVVIAVGLCYLLCRNERRYLLWVNTLLMVVVAGLLSVIFCYCLYDITTISDDYMYSIHFNVIFHAMVQVFLGKEILIDFVHQYGLYPHFLEPVFTLTGLSLISFTTIIGILTVLTFLFLFLTLLSATASPTVALLGFLALVSGGYVSKIISSYDPYFQYFPLRTIFPAAAAWFVASYLKSRSNISFVSLYVLSSIAVLWNPETGIVVMIAVLLTTFYDEYFLHNLRSALFQFCKGLSIFVAVIAFFSCYMYLRYGVFPDYRELVSYARLFYVTGFYMLPMVPLHPWNLVILVYVAGLCWGIGALVNGSVTHQTSVVTFLSLLGIGLFAYYQGRSHDEVLLLCVYPAFLLVTVFTDRLLTLGAENRLPGIAGFCGVIVLVFAAGGLYRGVSTIVYGKHGIVKRYETYRETSQTYVTKRADFIRDRTTRGEEVLILSGHSGLYSLISQTTNPIRTASIPETVLRADFLKILAYVDQGPCRKLFVDINELLYLHPDYQVLRDVLSNRYMIYGYTPDWKLAMFLKVR